MTTTNLASSATPAGPENLERILIGVCTVLWLGALGAGVAAVVALVDLGNGRGSVRADLSGSDTPWLLYTVIGVSAVVIAVAIPLLMRARAQSGQRPATAPGTFVADKGSVAAAISTVKLRGEREQVTTRRAVRNAEAGINEIYLRCALVIGSAVGAGILAVGVATYLMATGHQTPSWAAYIVAGLVTVGMGAAPWYFLRELHALIDAADAA